MIEVGSVIKSKFRMDNHVARMGLVIKVVEANKSNLAQVFWPHNRTTGWVKCEDMEIVSESR